ncbi:unnamed protein product, partial [Symbiodinium pilosum]
VEGSSEVQKDFESSCARDVTLVQHGGWQKQILRSNGFHEAVDKYVQAEHKRNQAAATAAAASLHMAKQSCELLT